MQLDPDRDYSVEIGLDDPDDLASLAKHLAAQLGVPADELPALEVRKRSIDARRGRVRFHIVVGTVTAGELGGAPPREVSGAPVLIVGGGPAGLFCAYELARAGVKSIIVDRGKPVQARRGDIRDVIEILTVHGAPHEILLDARPHIGSNKLPKVITAMRERLEHVGSEVRFGARVVELVVHDGRAIGVRLAGGDELIGRAVVVATGHSARDVHDVLERAGVRLEAKPFAMGVRIEHPQPLIDQIQYGRAAGHPKLPPAPYKLAFTPADKRGAFSFCMCPGGWIVPAATEPDGVVVNGMSLSRRDSPFANSGLVVSVELADLARLGLTTPTGGVELQRRLERAAATAGGGELRAPATRVTDFLRGKPSSTVPASSYQPGLAAGDVGAVLDTIGIPLAARLREALAAFEGQMRGFVTSEAVLVGVESRTSSPVRVPRDAVRLESPDVAGLYPCGEGAGFAGGIVSAALDGIRVARAITG